jgi:hypothetical protein
MPQLVGRSQTTGNAAAVSTTTLFTTQAQGQYLIMWNAKRTTADTVSSTLGAVTIVYTDPDNTSMSVTAPATVSGGTIATTNTTDSTSVTGALWGMPLLLNCKSGTVITFAVAYVSNTPGNMVYNFNIAVQYFPYN